MRLYPEKLASHLAGTLLPIYVVSGEEPLQHNEACDAIRTAARRNGASEREVLHVESGFDWQALLSAGNSLSLFAEQRLLELRLPSGKPGDVGARVLAEYAANPPQDTVLLVVSGKLEKAQLQSKWYKALDQVGATIQVWPVEAAALPAWIGRRMQALGMQPETDAVTALAERVEGNLLAAEQEIEKLFLLYGAGPLNVDQVLDAVADSARYNLFALADTALGGEAARAVRMAEGLRGEGVEPTLLLWALSREVRSLERIADQIGRGSAEGVAFKAERVWESRSGLYRSALRRHPVERWQRFLAHAARIDRIIKGQEPGNSWDELIQLILLVAGVNIGIGRGAPVNY